MLELDLVGIGKIIFYISIAPLILYSFKYYFFSFASIASRKKPRAPPGKIITPKVSIHIPVYNDPVVVECVKSCMKFDYPKNKVEIIVADDSTDQTSELLDKLHKETNGAFKIVRRTSRTGYKAGALNLALKHSTSEVIVIFDSDYILDRSFLKDIVQPFVDSKIGYVQTRWDYLNAGKNWVSRLAMTAYAAFHQCSMPIKEKIGTAIFCGTGGALRTQLLRDAGGWNEDSIAEDLDITVRILQKGYRQAYLPDVKARGEVPSTLMSFIRQQQRWAYGTTSVMKKEYGNNSNQEKSMRQLLITFTRETQNNK